MIQQGIKLLENGDTHAARQIFTQLLNAQQHIDLSLRYLGISFQNESNFVEALSYFKQLIQLTPKDPNVWNAAGTCHSNLFQLNEATDCFKRAIKLSPKTGLFYSNLGFVLYQQGEYREASKAIKKALNIDPKLAIAWRNLGHCATATNQFSAAGEYYNRALKIEPEIADALSGLIFANKSTCNWKNINQYEKLLISQSEKLINSGLKTHVTPFTAIFLKLSNIQQQQIFKSYASHNSKPQNPLWHKQITSNKNKLRIGYVSSAYRDHATSHLIHALFQYHDYNQVEVYCYAGTKPDLNVSAVQSIQHYSDYFFDLSELSDSDAAIKISNDQIQILIDLDGYTTSNRHGIFKWRPAPIQVNFLGFPGSMGANWNQYIIGDNTVTPAEWDTTCTESPVRMPNCYQLNSHKYLTVDPTPTRDSLSLPDDAIIYCCFNIARKIESTVFNCWMEILKSVPKAMLWILVDDKITKDNILREAAKRGIDKTRLAFAKRVPSAENLARQKIADVFLDTFFCTAHTTASDALWAGLPVITMRGDTFANRVAASIVSAAGLAECITSTPEQYTALAITLGNNPNQLAKLKHKLEHNREQCALFDTPLYVKHLEQAFQQMWINHQANQVKPIDVKP